MNKILHMLLLALLACVSALPARAAEILLGDGARARGEVVFAGGKFTLQDEKGAREIAAPALAVFGGAPLTAEPAETVCLSDGSVLAGEILAGKTAAEIQLRREGAEPQSLAVSAVIALELNPLDAGISPERELTVPGLVMRNGKVMPCAYEWISAIEVGIRTDAGRLRLSRKSIHRVVLNPGAVPVPAMAAGTVLALTTGGEAVGGTLTALNAEGCRIAGAGGEMIVARSTLFALSFGAEGAKSLGALKPTRIVTKPYLDYIMQPSFGRRYAGDLLRVRGIVFPAGVLTHARTEITYQLDGSTKWFAALVGMDSALSAAGQAVFEVRCDGKAAATLPVNARQEPALLSVPTDKVRELTLVLDYGPGGSIGDHGVWGVPVLFGK